MAFESLKIGYYTVENFAQEANSVRFYFRRIDEYDITIEDVPRIEIILNELGKWEGVLKAGHFLLSELGLVKGETSIPHEYRNEFDFETYDVTPFTENFDDGLLVRITLSMEERRRRRTLGLGDTLQLQEVYDQLKNVPKWEALQKALKLARENV